MTELQTVNDYIDADLVHSIHTTERRSFRGCRRRWHWIFKDGYYPQVTAKPLEFGIAYHKAMEVWYDPDMWGIDQDTAQLLAIETFRKECNEQLESYLEKTNQNRDNVDPEVLDDYNDRIVLGTGMLVEYAKTSRKIDVNFKPIFVEKKFEVPITGPNGETIWCKCDRCRTRFIDWVEAKVGWESLVQAPDEWPEGVNFYPEGAKSWYLSLIWKGLPVTYGGRIDMLAEDELGRYWVFDWKTAARLSTGEPGAPDDYLFLDDQITAYCWALQIVLGLDIAGFVYHEQKKAYPAEPEPLKRVREGRIFSVNKAIDCDWETYEKIVSENDPVAYDNHLYDAFIDYLREFGGVFYKRHQISRTQIELVNAGLNVYDEACDITNPNLRIYPSAGRFSCTYCAFQDPCLGKNRGDDYEYTLATMYDKRERHYFQEPSTDKPDRG